MGTSQKVTGRNIRILSEDDGNEAAVAWHNKATGRATVREHSAEQDIEKEEDCIEATLVTTLDSHATVVGATPRSKLWWTTEVKAKLKEYGKIRRLYQQGRGNAFSLKAVRNTYYYLIRLAKRQGWWDFLQKENKTI